MCIFDTHQQVLNNFYFRLNFVETFLACADFVWLFFFTKKNSDGPSLQSNQPHTLVAQSCKSQIEPISNFIFAVVVSLQFVFDNKVRFFVIFNNLCVCVPTKTARKKKQHQASILIRNSNLSLNIISNKNIFIACVRDCTSNIINQSAYGFPIRDSIYSH